METIGQRVARIRKFRGLTQETLSKTVDVSYDTIRAIEADRWRTIDARAIGKIAQALNCSTDYLILGGNDGIETTLQRRNGAESSAPVSKNRPVSWCSGLYSE